MSIINLLPEDYIRKRYQRRANLLCLGLLGAVILGVGAAILVSRQSLSRTREVLDRVDSDYAEAAKLLGQLQELDLRKRAILAKASAAQELQERVPRSYLLGLVTNALPESGSLTNLRLQVQQPTGARPAKRGPQGAPSAYTDASGQTTAPPMTVEMIVKGLAGTDIDVARFIAALARCQLIATVDLAYSQEKVVDKLPMREFEVRAQLRPGVDVIETLGDKAHELAATPSPGGGA